ncbi:MAG TPA: nuclear transport factor 2 family protein [Dermatophilaceae bacterium]|nr:nuclear transport factor 2 family protein [Dermatophilaceae bacterium]
MYHAIVARRTAAVFSALNGKDAGPLLRGMRPDAVHAMNGDHALGGARCRPETVRAWYDRLFQLFPDLRFTVDAINVTGWPWRTTVVVQWRDQALAGGYANQGVNVVDLAWGRIRGIRIHCDTARLATALAGQAERGVAGAAAEQLTDQLTAAQLTRTGGIATAPVIGS